MGELRCVDGSLLRVAAIPCFDRAGQPYEITLDIARDSLHFATVGQRCGHQLAWLVSRVRAAREDPEQTASWPDADDRFPRPDVPLTGPAAPPARPAVPLTGPAAPPARPAVPLAGPADGTAALVQPGLTGFQPGELEYFTLRSKDRGDLPGTGEMRCALRSFAQWHDDGPGGWRLSRRALVEAWGADGTGVRAVLTSAELVTFLDTVLREPDDAVVAGPSPADGRAAGGQPRQFSWPAWWQRGKVPDGSARSPLPTLRAAARTVPLAVGSAQARWGDVRR